MGYRCNKIMFIRHFSNLYLIMVYTYGIYLHYFLVYQKGHEQKISAESPRSRVASMKPRSSGASTASWTRGAGFAKLGKQRPQTYAKEWGNGRIMYDNVDDDDEEEKRTCEKKGGGYGIQVGITNKNHYKTIFIFCEDVRIVHHGLCRRHWWGNGTLRRLARCQGCRRVKPIWLGKQKGFYPTIIMLLWPAIGLGLHQNLGVTKEMDFTHPTCGSNSWSSTTQTCHLLCLYDPWHSVSMLEKWVTPHRYVDSRKAGM